MPTFRNASPASLICNETVAVAKEYNLRRHHNTKHTNFKDSYPEQSEARQRKMATLKSACTRANGIITRTLTDQERVRCASLQAAWVLCKHNRPFTESELLKESMVTVLEERCPRQIHGQSYCICQTNASLCFNCCTSCPRLGRACPASCH